MTRYLALRLLSVVPTLFGISVLVFGITYLIPGDPALIMAGSEATPEAVAGLRRQWGLDEPAYVRYAAWLGNLTRGNFGDSYFSRQTVLQLVGNALPITLELAILSLLVAVLIAVPTGIVSAVKAGSWFDVGAAALGFVGLSIPGFWLGIMLIYVFAVYLQLLPAGGFTHSEFVTGYSGGRRHQAASDQNVPDRQLYDDWTERVREQEPPVIVDTAAADLRGGRYFPMRRFEALQRLVDDNYDQVAEIERIRVYVRRPSSDGVPAGSGAGGAPGPTGGPPTYCGAPT